MHTYLSLVADITNICSEAVILDNLLHDHAHKAIHIWRHFLVRPKLITGVLSVVSVGRVVNRQAIVT